MSAEVLAHVPGCDGEAPLAVSAFATQSVNRSLRVRTPAGEFVVRINGERGGGLTPDRRREARLQELAARARLAPRIVWADPTGGTLICEHVRGRVWTRSDLGEARQLARLGERLAVLHGLSTPRLAPFDPAGTARRYRGAIREAGAAERAELDRWLAEIEGIVPRIGSENRTTSIIHGDLHHTNIIEGESLVLIDWEYAALADPLLDLGCLLAYYPEARVHAAELLVSAGLAATADREALASACELYVRLNALWERAVTAALPSGAGAGESSD